MNDKFFINTLKKLNHILEEYLTDFVPFKLHGKDNLIRQGKDSLYYMKKKATIAVIYITPHFIFTHDNGDITADTLSRIKDDDSLLIPRPLLRLRGYDGRCVELFEHGYEPIIFKQSPPSLEMFHDFVAQIHLTFTRTYYLPYLVHPFRLLRRNRKILILSHMLHYIFAPYNEDAQIKDLHFSHPHVFEPKNENDDDYLIEMTRSLILNFFHSLTITFLWFLNGQEGNLLNIRNREIGFIRNDDKRWYHPEKIKKTDDSHIIIKPCRIKKGICQGLALYNSVGDVNEIHTYACHHLLTVLPQTLRDICKIMREKNDRQILIQAIEKQFILFNAFCSKFKNGD